MADFGYPGRWRHLLIGRSGEYSILSMLSKIAANLSENHGIRLSIYKPDLDIDLTDLLIRLETKNWIIFFQAQVRARQSGTIPLGQKNSYGTICSWASEAEKSSIPVILFVLGNGNQFDFYETRRLRQYFTHRSSVPSPSLSSESIEASFTRFILNVSRCKSAGAACRLISKSLPPISPGSEGYLVKEN